MRDQLQIVGYELDDGHIVRYFTMEVASPNGAIYQFYMRPGQMYSELGPDCIPINGALATQEMQCRAARLYHTQVVGNG